MCNGIQNPDLEEFMQYKFGFSVLDNNGYPWGEKLKGWTTFRARLCTRVAFAKKGRCAECDELNKAMLSARTRHNNSALNETQKFTPTSALKVSPYVRDLIAQFRKENKPQPEIEEKEDDIEVEVSTFIFFSSKYTHDMCC